MTEPLNDFALCPYCGSVKTPGLPLCFACYRQRAEHYSPDDLALAEDVHPKDTYTHDPG